MRARHFIGFALIIAWQAFIIAAFYYFDTSSHWTRNIIEASALLLPFISYLLIFYHAPAFASWPRFKRLIIFTPSSVVPTVVGFYFFLFFWFIMSFGGWPWEHYLPPERRVRQQFENHRADYIRLVNLLQKDPSATYIGSDGRVDIDGVRERFVPEYKDLIHKIGAKFVTVSEDGSMEFALWGFGCAICSDSYMGVRYFPKNHKVDVRPGWTQTVVTSLDSAKLPQENGSVASGLYVTPIEPEWFIYRLEIQE